MAWFRTLSGPSASASAAAGRTASASQASTIRASAPRAIRFSLSAICFSAGAWASAMMYFAPIALSRSLMAASSVFQRSSWKLDQETPTTKIVVQGVRAEGRDHGGNNRRQSKTFHPVSSSVPRDVYTPGFRPEPDRVEVFWTHNSPEGGGHSQQGPKFGMAAGFARGRALETTPHHTRPLTKMHRLARINLLIELSGSTMSPIFILNKPLSGNHLK